MYRITGLLLSLLVFNVSFSQQVPTPVQWASRVIKYSSQYGPKGFSATQVLGKPNAYPAYGKSLVAWQPAEGKRNLEYVQVAFDVPVSGVQQIAIAETYNVGAVSKVILIDVNGKEYVVFQNQSPHGDRVPEAFLNKILFSPTGYRVAQLRLELNTTQFPDNPQIDAIGISTSRESIVPGINLVKSNTQLLVPQNLGPGINTEYDDMLPIISPDGNTLYFARKKSPENIGAEKADDIYVSTKDVVGRWTPAIHLGPPLNDDNHNFVCSVSPDGNTLVLANKYSNGRGDGVSVSYKKGQGWTKPQPLPIINMYNRSPYACYHMGVDGKTMVMAIERDDTYGDMDLYASFMYADGQWTEPMNLGPIVNTAAAEASVFLAADGKTIYFSSQGHPGFGQFDVYMSKRLDNTWRNWSEPLNLGPPFNSPVSDYYYTIPASGEYAYFSSNDNSYGRSDLFRIPLPPELRPEPVTMLKANVQTASAQQPPSLSGNKQQTASQKSLTVPVQPQQPVTLVVPANDPDVLYNNFRGYYPVEKNATSPVPGLLEEDNAKNAQTIPQTKEQQQLNELQARLQQLKNEQASVQYTLAQKTSSPVILSVPNQPLKNTGNTQAPVNSQTIPSSTFPNTQQGNSSSYSQAPQNQLSALDAKLAELRSKKDQLANNRPSTAPLTASAPAYISAQQPPVNSPSSNDPYPGMSFPPSNNTYPPSSQSYPANPAYPTPVTNSQQNKANYPPQQQAYAPVSNQPSAADKMTDYTAKINELKKQQQGNPTSTSVSTPPETNPSEQKTGMASPISTDPKSSQDPLKAYEEKLLKLRTQTTPPEMEQKPVVLNSSPPQQTSEIPILTVQSPPLQQGEVVEEALILPPVNNEPAVEQQKNEELLKGNEQLQQNNQELSSQNEQLNTQKNQLDSLIKTMEAERESIAEEKRKLEEEKSRLEQQKSDQLKEIAQLERQIEQLSQSKFKTQAELQQAKLAIQQPEPKYTEKQEDIILMPLEKGAVLQVDNIYFNANATFLKPESYKQLDKIVAFLRSNPNIKVEIGGHTNGLCDDDFCLYLSDGRAKAVKEYIISQGISSGRVTHMGYGKRMPIADNNTTDGRLRNQRVEMKIIEVN